MIYDAGSCGVVRRAVGRAVSDVVRYTVLRTVGGTTTVDSIVGGAVYGVVETNHASRH